MTGKILHTHRHTRANWAEGRNMLGMCFTRTHTQHVERSGTSLCSPPKLLFTCWHIRPREDKTVSHASKCALTWLQAFSTHTRTHTCTHTHVHTLCVAQQVRIFHKSGHVCWRYALARCCNCVFYITSKWEDVNFQRHTRVHTSIRRNCSLIILVSKESPWQWQRETTAWGRGGACASYRPRSGLFPQEVSYSPQANQRTKSEMELKSNWSNFPELHYSQTACKWVTSQQKWSNERRASVSQQHDFMDL